MTTEEIIAGLWEIIDHGCINQQHRIDALEDAITFIRYHTPRVLTIEEVTAKPNMYNFDNGTLVWLEDRSDGSLTPVIYSCFNKKYKAYEFWTIGDEVEWSFPVVKSNVFCNKPVYVYNHNWRCWSQRPSDEQKKAVKWNDD